MTATRTRAIISGTVLAVLAIALSLSRPASDVRGEVHPSFDPAVHVQLNAAGIDVYWVSAAEEDGYVEWALSAADLASSPNTATDVRGDFATRLNQHTHRVSASGVAGGSTIHYQIVSGGVTSGPFSVTIPSTPLTSPPNLLEGFVRYPDSSLGLECIVSMRVTNKEPFDPGSADAHSLWVNGLTNAAGEYVLDITNIRGNPANAFFNNNADRAFSYLPSAATSEITVIARCDADNVGQTVKTTLDAAFTDAGYKNFDVQLGPLSPSFSIADASVGESTGAATLTISLQPAASASTAVSWATADGTATAPADYTASSGTVLFAAGVTSKAVTVPVTDDAVDDPDETFSVTLSGPIGAAVISIISGSATVTIVDDQPPVAADDSYSVPEDQTLSVAALGVLANDTARPGLALTAAKVTDPSSGTLTLSPDGSFTYAPVSVSVQTFTYKANDGTLDSNVATVTINVTQGNRPPVAIDDFYAVTSGQVFTVSAPGVLDNDTDPDGDPLTAVLVTDIPAAEGAVALGTDGFFIYPTFPRSAAWVRRNPVRVLPI